MGDVLSWLTNLAERAEDLPKAASRRPYWSERQQSDRAKPSVTTQVATGRRARALIDEMMEEFYFAEALGFDCFDSHGDSSTSLESELDSRVGKPNLWGSTAEEWDKDDLCDVIEVFHDLAARPTTGWHHSFNDCGWHPTTFSRRSGQIIYTWKMNLVLDGSSLGLRLAPFSAVRGVLFFPGWGDVEVVEDGSLGGGEAVESDAVVGVGESEALERGEGVVAGG